MGRLLIVEPMPIAAIAASRGTGILNLLTPDPKEVWADQAVGTSAGLYLDLGQAREIDTIFVGYVGAPAPAATWLLSSGVNGPDETVLMGETPLRVPDVAGRPAARSHALWRGDPRPVRHLGIVLTQPAGAPPLTVGVVVVGRAFVAQLGKEWGSGRRPIDTGTATALDSGGFAVVEGARKSAYGWTFGDLTIAEADQLDAIAEALGSSRPALVVEDPDPTPGLVRRIHYGLFQRWRAYERRNRRQTRWELEIEQWT